VHYQHALVLRRECPERIGNGDETGWQRSHRFTKGIMPKGIKVSYRPGDEDKESFTQFMFALTAGDSLSFARQAEPPCMGWPGGRGPAGGL
jgi:hypothetical protein